MSFPDFININYNWNLLQLSEKRMDKTFLPWRSQCTVYYPIISFIIYFMLERNMDHSVWRIAYIATKYWGIYLEAKWPSVSKFEPTSSSASVFFRFAVVRRFLWLKLNQKHWAFLKSNTKVYWNILHSYNFTPAIHYFQEPR